MIPKRVAEAAGVKVVIQDLSLMHLVKFHELQSDLFVVPVVKIGQKAPLHRMNLLIKHAIEASSFRSYDIFFAPDAVTDACNHVEEMAA